MSHNTFAATNLVAARAASRSILKILGTGLMFLLLTHLPAFADHVHLLSEDKYAHWSDTDLTALTGGPDSVWALAAFYTTPNYQLHVYYNDGNTGDVHELFYDDPNWSDTDLSALTGAPPDEGFISGFSIDNLQYVFYVDVNGHVQELNYNNENWTATDLTALVGGPGVQGADSGLLAFATKPNNQFHVYYTPVTLDLDELYFDGTSWSNSDLTSTYLHGDNCLLSHHIAGFAVENEQHLFCVGFGSLSKHDLLHIYYNNATWVKEDISVKTGVGKMYPNAGVAGFKVPGESQFEVYSFTENAHVNQFTHVENPAQWTDYDLSAGIGASGDGFGGGMVAIPADGSYNVYYAPDGEVYQLFYYDSSWSVNDLTGGTGSADPSADMAGFVIPVTGLQYIFYMSTD
jgi:hypothetical protein